MGGPLKPLSTLPGQRFRYSGLLLTDGIDLLLLRRAPGFVNAGVWGVAAGERENQEKAEETARRECAEEIGFVPPYRALAWWRNDDFVGIVALVDPECKRETIRLEHESDAALWVDQDWCQAHQSELHPGEFPVIEAVDLALKVAQRL